MTDKPDKAQWTPAPSDWAVRKLRGIDDGVEELQQEVETSTDVILSRLDAIDYSIWRLRDLLNALMMRGVPVGVEVAVEDDVPAGDADDVT